MCRPGHSVVLGRVLASRGQHPRNGLFDPAYAIATGFLASIQRFVGRVVHGGGQALDIGGRVVRAFDPGEPERRGDAHGGVVGTLQRESGDGDEHPIGYGTGAAKVGLRKDGGELFTARAGYDVDASYGGM